MELRRYLLLVWRWSWLLTLAVVLGAAAAYGVSRLQTPAYVAQATILVNQAQAVTGPTYNDVLANQQLSKTYSQLVTSGPVLDRVAAQFDIPYETLERKVSAKVRRDTQLIDIRARDADAERAAAIANAIATVFAEQIRQAQLGQQSTAESDLQAQVDALQASITDKQREVSRLSAATPAPADADRQQNLVAAQGQLDSLRQNLAAVQRRLQDLRIDLARSINSVTIAHPARAPKRPAAPLVLVNTALGAALGLLMAGGFVALRAYLDDTVKNAGDVTRATAPRCSAPSPRSACRAAGDAPVTPKGPDQRCPRRSRRPWPTPTASSAPTSSSCGRGGAVSRCW
ncbi:MAG: Wzz/FepE/Etk N-terminal domain-containing protein [Dehalococcoidia bacterium]